MKLHITSLVLIQAFTLGLSQGQCATKSISQCATDCGCSRVACCCGSGCNLENGDEEQVKYTLCVDAGSDPNSWNCPSPDQCGAAGLVRSVSPCEDPADMAPPGTEGGPKIAFGTTFPMIGTQAVPEQTWHHNIYMGTNLQFNPGAYWSYTNSYVVPHMHYAGDDDHTADDHNSVGPAPTAQPAYEGQPCYGYLMPCPAGYYCAVEPGYNPQQKGQCKQDTVNAYGWGVPTHNNHPGTHHMPPPATTTTATIGNSNIQTFPGGNMWFSQQTDSCAPPSVCGFQSLSGSCWCDGQCTQTNDCCSDINTHCPNVQASAPTTYNTAAAVPCTGARNGDCTGKCGPGAVTHPGGKCYCDGSCLAYNDCCCNYQQVCG